MRFVRGKRQYKEERLWGFVLVNMPNAGVKCFGLVIGYYMWGIQWKSRKTKKSSVASVRSSPKSPPPTENKSSKP